jgi:G2/mitotic-specific cyclin-B, other
MAHQSDINPKMRAILVDWLVDVHLKFKLMPETLHLTVNLIDRYLERKVTVRSRLQLVGVTAMLLASKYEEIYAPEVRDFTYITDSAYTRQQILSTEASMLAALKFKVTVPTAYVFTRRYLKAAKLHEDRVAINLAHYLVERTLQEYSMLRFLPSVVAAAAVNITARTLASNPRAWDATLEHYTQYKQADLEPCVRAIEALLDDATSTLHAVEKKYATKKYFEASKIRILKL